MMRLIVTPPVLLPAALAELKDWLGISIPADDAGLTDLLNAALEVCADYIGMAPLVTTVEEIVAMPAGRLPAPADWQSATFPRDWHVQHERHGWHRLSIRPVSALIAVERRAADGRRSALSDDQYAACIDGDGQCFIRITADLGFDQAVVRVKAGMAREWSALPEALRHGIMRLAAHHYRQRENSGAESLPPASVIALWRPWRRIRIA